MSSAANLVVFVAALTRLTSGTQDPTPTEIGIKDGLPIDDDTFEIVGECTPGTVDTFKVYECSGQENYLKWNINYCTSDFKIISTFKASGQLGETSLSFVFWEGASQYHIGLDGADNNFFFEQGEWDTKYLGPTTLERRGNNDGFQTIELQRDGGKLSVKLDGASVAGMESLAAENICVDAVGWRPWDNKIRVQDLFEMQFEVVPGGYEMSADMGSGSGNTISAHEDTTVQECAEECDKEPECAGFTMTEDETVCTLKSEVILKSTSGEDTYVKEVATSTPAETAPETPPTPPPTVAPVPGSSVLTEVANVGDTSLECSSELGFNEGDLIEIDGGGNKETAVIASFGTIVIADGLDNAFPVGAAVNVVQAPSCEVESFGCEMECEADGLAQCGKTCCELYEEALVEIHQNSGSTNTDEVGCDQIQTIVEHQCAFCAACDVQDANRLLTNQKALRTEGLLGGPRAGQWPLPGAATAALAALGAAAALGAVALGRRRAASAPASTRALEEFSAEEQSEALINSADC